jgi:peptide/nickel transport system substrate-binding protein
MKNRKIVASVAVVGLVASFAASTSAGAATKTTKKKAAKKPTKPAAATTTPATTAPAATTAPPAAAAAKGGKLTFGMEAETNNWIPGPGSWAVSGHTVSYALTERLFGLNAKGVLSPWLADSMTVDRTGLVWTIKLKSGIKFHNGEAFDAAAVKANLDEAICGAVLLPVFLRINAGGALCSKEPLPKLLKGTAVVDATTLTLTSLAKFPGLPTAFAGQGGVMIAPQQIKDNNGNIMIGTGPFKFKSYQRDVALNVVRNDDYWRKDHMPKLDEIEFRPIPDENARIAQIAKGDLDITHTANFSSKAEFEKLAKDGKAKVVSGDFMAEVNHDVLNNSIAPFNTEECRLAAAYGMDVPTLIKLKAPGAKQANGPFSPAIPGWVANSGAPTYNIDKAKANYETCKAKLGGKDVEFTMATTNDPEAGEIRDIMAAMMEKVGFNVKKANIEQSKYITTVLLGATQWATWRYYGGIVDLDVYRFQMHSETAAPNGGVSLNWQRAKDGQVDAAFDLLRDNTDPAVRKSAAESIFRQYAEKAYILPRWVTVWTVAYGNKVNPNLESLKLVNGDAGPLIPFGYVVDFANITKG